MPKLGPLVLMPKSALLFVLATAAAIVPTFAQDPALAPEPVRYGRDVRPILADRCFRCHGPDAATREADLRLDVRDDTIRLRGDVRVIAPEEPAASLLLARVRAADPDERMPPPHSGKAALTEAEIGVLERWIAGGADYEEHWAFVPPARPPVPAAAAHPVDAFLDAARQRQGLAASPPADRATQQRRLFLVLTGLPPTPDERAAFLADARPDAYERLVDRLLGEPPYRTRHAEHLARLWLDAARYADTSGIHTDAGRQAWPWRDWLLHALVDDMPFDRFVVEQLAGDLLPDATQEQHTATGFLRQHVTTDEGGAIGAEYLVEYAAERTSTVGSVLLGMTVGCARCHDHKYDPFRQEDYYRLFSFFNSNDEPGLYSQDPDPDRAFEPFLPVPTAEQTAEQQRLQEHLATARASLAVTTPEEQHAFATFRRSVASAHGIRWQPAVVLAAASANGATLQPQLDGSVLAAGENPARDTHEIVLRTDGGGQRWICLEALTDPSLPEGKVGRAPNGNAVLSRITFATRATGGGGDWEPLPVRWAIADVEQQNGDFAVINALDDEAGWAVAAHTEAPRARKALFLAERSFGDGDGGTELRVTLSYESEHAQHVLGRVRFSTSAADESSFAQLPLATSGFHLAGPFTGLPSDRLYDEVFGPETATRIDRAARWGKQAWRYEANRRQGVVETLRAEPGVTFVAQTLRCPDHRRVKVALGSDDGFQLFLDGQRVAERRIDRGAALDQDEVELELTPGQHLLVLKVVNTGGQAGFALRHVPSADELVGDLRLLVLPNAFADAVLARQIGEAYRQNASPQYREAKAEVGRVEASLRALEASIPRAMVMRELPMPRPTFVLDRGEYDKPDASRPVSRDLPAMFGEWPDDQPRNRLGLARWIVSENNPLWHRVTVNRLWEFVFGQGLVRTSEDFGLQGEWPSHPELLDWLAVEFRERGHSVRALLRLLVTSEAFRQASAVPAHAGAKDPEGRLLAWFPRRRLAAEAIRDQALFAAGLLVERLGGPSVKPPQPEGLWQEVAMPQSNTRTFVADMGEGRYRRSIYTYWKRACPPPNLATFDAPNRESCTIRRSVTNTPLQALVLWNDDQFVTAARALARRVAEAAVEPAQQVALAYELATGRTLPADPGRAAVAALESLRRRYEADPQAAAALAAGDDAAPALAALTLLCNTFLALDATITID
jgi:hypothetical protein